MLTFITEQTLREKYKSMPFETFTVEDSERLTPGGRQYLLDKQIKIVLKKEEDKKRQIKGNMSIKKGKNEELTEVGTEKEIKRGKKILYKLKSIEALLFSFVSETLEQNIIMAQKILEISREFRDLNKNYEMEDMRKIKNMIQVPENETLEVHDIYIHNKNATEIFKLQSVLYEMRFLEEIILSEEEMRGETEILIHNLKYIGRKILIVIIELLGGEQCQEKK